MGWETLGHLPCGGRASTDIEYRPPKTFRELMVSELNPQIHTRVCLVTNRVSVCTAWNSADTLASATESITWSF